MHHELIGIGHFYKIIDHSSQYYGKVISKDNKILPYIGIENISDGVKKSIQSSDFRNIQTTKEHLEKLGFTLENVEGQLFYVLGNVVISSFSYSSPSYVFISGFRLVKNWNPWKEIDKYIVNNQIERDSFDRDFEELNEINALLKVLKENKIPVRPINEILSSIW